MRAGAIRAKPRTQECLAVSGDDDHWFLINASPEIRAQIESFPPIRPRAPRHSPIAGIVVTSGDLDHCLGLLSLRESQPLTLYSTDAVRRGFCERNVFFRTLRRFEGQVTWKTVELGVEIPLALADGDRSGLFLLAAPAPGKLPIHLEGLEPHSPEVNVGLRIREEESGRTLAYVSSTAAIDGAVRNLVSSADCVFFDGTFWSDDELVALALGTKRARDMAHLPVGGESGALHELASIAAKRRIFIHVNNTNPMLREDSPEAAAVRAAGWEIAEDGMEIAL